jgi:hypothetical protein
MLAAASRRPHLSGRLETGEKELNHATLKQQLSGGDLVLKPA